jgi:hypothetical protein
MKFKISLYIILCTLIHLSCSKSYLDINTDPNNPTDVPAKTLLPTTTMGMAFANSNELGKVAAHLMQYSAGVSGNAYSYDQYIIASLDNQWKDEVYGGTLNNLQILIDKTQASSPAYSGIAKLEKAYLISLATDLWGDIPYMQAGQGLKYVTPVFDAQKDIYLGNAAKGVTSLFNLVRSGLSDLASPSILTPSTDDIIFKGDLTKWTRFGNSLLLKFALQVSNPAIDTTKSVINAILNSSAPFINSSTYDFIVPYTTANPNAYYMQDFGGSIPGTQMLSNSFLALMRNQKDSLRLSKYFTKPAANFIGYDNGSPFAAPTSSTRSLYGSFIVGTAGEAPVRLLTSYQISFLLAEATLLYGVAGDPNAYYQAGIKASMKAAGLADADINSYFTNNPTIVSLTGTTSNKLNQIITQKYIALIGNAIESYNDYRRTGFPVLSAPLTTGGDDPTTLPKRFPYTISETNGNPNQPNPRPLTNVKVWWGL